MRTKRSLSLHYAPWLSPPRSLRFKKRCGGQMWRTMLVLRFPVRLSPVEFAEQQRTCPHVGIARSHNTERSLSFNLQLDLIFQLYYQNKDHYSKRSHFPPNHTSIQQRLFSFYKQSLILLGQKDSIKAFSSFFLTFDSRSL